MRESGFVTGPEQYGVGFEPLNQVEGGVDLKPKEKSDLEVFISDIVAQAAGTDEVLKQRMFTMLDSHNPTYGQNFGALAEKAVDAVGNELTLRERLAANAIAKNNNKLDREDLLEDALRSWVDSFRKKN